MTTNTNTVSLAKVERYNQRSESSEAMRIAQYSWLSEMPGLVFGVLTLAWILTSLVALA